MINCDLILGLLFIFAMTSAGAFCSLFISEQKNNCAAYGFSAGVMISASFWSLLLPAKEYAVANARYSSAIPLSVGTALGCAAIFVLDLLFSANLSLGAAGKYGKTLIAVTVHNVPEGMAVGAAYGAIAASLSGGRTFAFGTLDFEKFAPALGVAFGIGVQNLPEGFATSLCVKNYSQSGFKAVALGVLSGAVEPVSGLIGALIAFRFTFFAPWLLSFSAGAMLYVCACDLIPDSCKRVSGIVFFVIGFCVMTALDVAL